MAQVYDPLISKHLPSKQGLASSYWHQTTSNSPEPAPPLNNTILNNAIEADVVIVGGGYTGLNCAINLAKAGVANIVVLEANQIGWGCSGRNAGFVLPGSGRLSYHQLVNRFGKAATGKIHNDFLQGVDLIREVATEHNIEPCDQGYLKLAHSAKWYERLARSADYLSCEFNYDVELIDREAFRQDYVDHRMMYGAIRYTNGFGINPLKLVQAYAKMAGDLGVKIYTNSSVTNIDSGDVSAKTNSQPMHLVETSHGSVLANKLVMATNGYTPSKMPTALSGKILPVLTSVIVTEPLTEKQLIEANFQTKQVMMDTRELKYYYRLLPDNRILFGGRGAISGKDATSPKYAKRLMDELKKNFPALQQLQLAYQWHGWISVSMDQMPHIYKTPNDTFYATGYCGSGVSFTALAGKQLADLVLEKPVDSPLVSELPHFPFAPFRRLGQMAYYQFGRFKDALG